MPDDETPEDRHPVKPKEAREQATDYLGFVADFDFDLGDGEIWSLPNPALMPPDMKDRYLEHLRFMSEDLDTKPRQNPVTGETDQIQVYPPRYKGKLVNDEVLLCVALMGDEGDYETFLESSVEDEKSKALKGLLPDVYEKFLKAGGVPGQINTAWQVMQRKLQERAQRDSKSS